MTSTGSLVSIRETKHTWSAKSLLRRAMTCRPRRVFPTPPGPIRVSRRISGRLSNSHTVAISCSRPTKEVNGVGKENLSLDAVSFSSREMSDLSCMTCDLYNNKASPGDACTYQVHWANYAETR